MADNVTNVTDGTFQAEVIEASKTQPVMVDFWAEWCRPCLMLAPTVAEVATAYAGKIKVVKLNVDENTNSAGQFNIRGIPQTGATPAQAGGCSSRRRKLEAATADGESRRVFYQPS
jgi:thioredoxin 1